MPAPRTTVWELEDHTRGKHQVLRNYLGAWFPILGKTQDRIAFIDGFAGPGEYSAGEIGSPLIALQTFENHRAPMRAHVNFLFIELDARRAQHLRGLVEPYRQRLGDRVTIDVEQGAFDESMSGLLDEVSERNGVLIPAFVMVDPFGISQTPMSVIARILRNPKSEVYVSFMWTFLNRFREHENFEQHLDDLFGCPDWRPALDIVDTRERKRFFFSLYRDCLKRAGAARAGAAHVVHFELYRGREPVYAIFFATGNDTGCDKMKQAIWKADPVSGTRFVPGSQDNFDLFADDTTQFANEIITEIASQDWVSFDRIETWAKTDATGYHSGRLKAALRSLEAANRIEVDPESRRRAMQFPSGTRLRVRV
jgi:three-Cys-motif partner protein